MFKKQNIHKIKNCRGNILFTVLVIGIIISLPLVAFMLRIPVIYNSYKHKRDKIISISLAESGVADAFKRWQNNFEWQALKPSADFIKVKFADYNYTVQSERLLFPEHIKIKAATVYNNIQSLIEQEFIIQSPLIYTLYSNSNILMNENSRINGHIKAEDIIQINENAVVAGNIITSKFIKNFSFLSDTQLFERRVFQKFELPDLKKIINNDSIVFLYDASLNNISFDKQLLFINNGLELQNCNFSNCALIVNGNLEINGNVNFSADAAYPFIIVKNNVYIRNNNNSFKGILTASGRVDVSGSLNMHGSIIADGIEFNGNTFIEYNKDYWSIDNSIFPKTIIKLNYAQK